jgi:hypothetical protein
MIELLKRLSICFGNYKSSFAYLSSYSDIVGLAPPPNYPPLNYGKFTEVVQIYDTALFIDPNATTTQTIVI